MKKKIVYALSALLVAAVVSTQIPVQAATTTTTITYPSKSTAHKPMTTKTVKKVTPSGAKGTTVKNTTETKTTKTNTTQKIPAGK